MPIAITRPVSPAIVRCELTHLERQPIDAARAAAQHGHYEQVLAELGCQVISLPVEPELPDSVFVEDMALVLPELAVITRPGAPSRRPEVEAVAQELERHRPLAFITPPATIDGGDVLQIGRRILVGLSSRTNAAAVEQLTTLLRPHGYAVEGVRFEGFLHLKSVVTQVGPETVLLNPACVEPATFAGLERIAVDPAEPQAANGLPVGDAVIFPEAYPRTAERLELAGLHLVRIDLSELAKAEAAVTCCSLILEE